MSKKQNRGDTGVKERPILFSGPMVRAILAGRKTQTRRVVKVQPSNTNQRFGTCVEDTGKKHEGMHHWINPKNTQDQSHFFRCPYGQPGDRLWVREKMCSDGDGWWYPSDEAGGNFNFPTSGNAEDDDYLPHVCDWIAKQDDANRVKVPAIHMPRWASRILLEVVSVRVERLEEISRGDCMAEGCPFPNIAKVTDPVSWYADLWRSLNGAESWDANPWVWVVEFKVLEKESTPIAAKPQATA